MQIKYLLQLIVFFYILNILNKTNAILIDTSNLTLPTFKGTIDLSDPDYRSHPEPVTPPTEVQYTMTNHMDRISLYTVAIPKTDNNKFSSCP